MDAAYNKKTNDIAMSKLVKIYGERASWEVY